MRCKLQLLQFRGQPCSVRTYKQCTTLSRRKILLKPPPMQATPTQSSETTCKNDVLGYSIGWVVRATARAVYNKIIYVRFFQPTKCRHVRSKRSYSEAKADVLVQPITKLRWLRAAIPVRTGMAGLTVTSLWPHCDIIEYTERPRTT